MAPPAAPAPSSSDPVAELIAQADQWLDTGIAELKQGHLNQARESFDKSIDTYLSAPGGAYGSPRVADAYRRTLETIHARELEALAAGDGFTEASSDPASIDEVAELAVPEAPTSDEVARTAQKAVEEEANDFPVELNGAVLACVELYQNRLREWFGAALARGGRYLPYIREVFAQEGIPQDLAYVALVESAFKTSALSRAKAKGVWQFMAATGKRYGLRQDWWVDERSSPEKATRAAARYLKTLHGIFGDWNLALAGYNAGENKIIRALNRHKAETFWEIARTKSIRRETKNYVPMIHAAIVVAKAPERYGFEIEPETAHAYETVAINGAVDLRTISECASSSLQHVQGLNPELRRLATPAGRKYDLRVPPGTAAAVQQCVDAIPPEQRVRFRTHVVARGETLSRIAKRYGARTGDIAQANGFAPTRRLKPGTDLIIPIDPRTKPVAATRVAKAQARPKTPAAPELAQEASVRVRHRVKPGDTLSTIATQYGTTIQALKSWNSLRGSRIAVGATLTIFTGRKF